jgi:protein SCO1/2
MNKKITLILVMAISAGLGLLISQRVFMPNALPSTAKPALAAATIIDAPRALPAFSLQSTKGTLTAEQLKGSWTVIFIGFTHCPDVCPTTLTDLARAQSIWAASQLVNKPKLLFVSVDPERDNPKLLADYAAFFNKDTLTATAPEAQLSEFTRSLGLVYMKVPQADSYTMDHSATLVLLNPNAEFAGLIRPPFNPETIASDLLALSKSMP